MVEPTDFEDIPIETRRKIFNKYPYHIYYMVMNLLRAYKSGLFKIENGKMVRTDPPPPPPPNEDKRMVKHRENLQRYEELKRKASVCRCPKGTHQQEQNESATAVERG